MEHLEFVRGETNPQHTGPEVFSLIVTGPDSTPIRMWCAVHLLDDHIGLYICEFELEFDEKNPLVPPVDEFASPTETLDFTPTHEELMESTISTSRPLRVLRAGRRRRGDAAAMEVRASPLPGPATYWFGD